MSIRTHNRYHGTNTTLALAAAALVAALTSTSALARGVDQRIINTESPRTHASEAVVERHGPRAEVLLRQEDTRGARFSETDKGRLGALPRPGEKVN